MLQKAHGQGGGAKICAFVLLRCVESFYAVFTNRAITNLSHAQATDDAGQINADFLRHLPILCTELGRAFAIGLLAPFLARVRVDMPISVSDRYQPVIFTNI